MNSRTVFVLSLAIGVAGFAGEIPPLPLDTATANGTYSTGDYGWWEDLYGVPLDVNGFYWSLSHLLGYETGLGDSFDQQDFESVITTDPKKIYRIADLITAWEEIHPELTVKIDPEASTVEIAEKK